MEFYSSVDHERPATPPMLVLLKTINSIDIDRRVASSKDNPQKVIKSLRHKIAVIDDND